MSYTQEELNTTAGQAKMLEDRNKGGGQTDFSGGFLVLLGLFGLFLYGIWYFTLEALYFVINIFNTLAPFLFYIGFLGNVFILWKAYRKKDFTLNLKHVIAFSCLTILSHVFLSLLGYGRLFVGYTQLSIIIPFLFQVGVLVWQMGIRVFDKYNSFKSKK